MTIDRPRTQPITSSDRGTEMHRGAAIGFLRFSLGYWRSPEALAATLLAGAAVGLLLLNVVINIGLNSWQRWFFDMLERKQAAEIVPALGVFAGLILAGAACAVAMVYCRMTLQMSWRRWITTTLIDRWVWHGRNGNFQVDGERQGSPEYRIVEDVRLGTEPLVELAIGFANALLLGVTFAGILLTVGGSLTVHLSGVTVVIPAYLCIAAVLYASMVSSLMFVIGQPLMRRVAQKNEAEGQFLFELSHAAVGYSEERSEPPGVRGAAAARAFETTTAAFNGVMRRWQLVIREYCRVTWMTNSNTFFAPVLPLFLAAPKYVSGELSLGAVMQLAAAFTIVLGALNWLTDNYVRIAEWSASARRVDELRHALDSSGCAEEVSGGADEASGQLRR